MNINGISSAYSSAASTARANQQTAGSSSDDSASAAANTRQSGAAPLSGIHIESRVQTTLPTGQSIAVFRFDLGLPDPSASSMPTDFEKRSDRGMLNELKQLAAVYNYTPGPDDIRYEGTAAIDRCV